MKVLRSTLVIGLAAFAAACGDKVTVAGPTPADTAPKVNSVTVSPSAVTMNIGNTVSFTAVVDVSNAAATTVTWSSSAANVTVTAAGVATAVSATPGVAVCATSTADATKKGCAQVVVSAATAVIPATVSIQSITINPSAGVPVNPAAVAGTIDVRVNVSPGNETVTKVVAMVGTTRADSQTFTAAQSAALRFAADEAIQTQSAFPPILFSINTAKFNATTGAATWVNGNYNVSVVLYVAGNTAARSTATYQTPLTFANANTYVLTSSFTGTTASATSGAGYLYKRGSLSVSALPVIYTSGITMAAGTISFGNPVATSCDRNGTSARAVALTAPVAPATAWTASIVYTPGSGAAAGDLDLYEYDATLGTCPAATLAVGESFTVTATDNNGNAFLAAAAAANAAANSYRVDNRPPVAPKAVQNPNVRQNGWVNASISGTATTTSATSNAWLQNGTAVGCATADCGVGGYNRMFRMATSAAGLVDEAIAAAASATLTLPAPSLTNTTYCAVISATDLLGNESALPAAGGACTAPVLASFAGGAIAAPGIQSQLFGVDIAGPTASFSNAAANLTSSERRLAAAIGQEFVIGVLDTGTVGNSGMLIGTPVRVALLRRNVTAGVETSANLDAAGAAAASSTPTSTGVGGALPSFNTTIAAVAIPGYYTATAFAVDAAGNSSATITRTIVFDDGVAVPADVPVLTTAVFSTPITGSTVTFNATASDNLDLRDVTYTLRYGVTLPVGLTRPILYPATTINGFNATPLLFGNVAANFTVVNFVRMIEQVTGNAPLAVAAADFPDQLSGTVRDQGSSTSAAAVTAIPAGAVPVTPAAFSYATIAAAQLTNSWAITNAATLVSDGAPVAPAVAANALSVTLNADAFGPTATYQAPFVRVDFYRDNGANLLFLGSSTTFSTVDDGTAQGRRHRYTFSFTPGTTHGLGALSIYAIGVNSAGNALMTPLNGNITVTNP